MGTPPQGRGDGIAMSARRLLIVLMNTDPRNPGELGAPFYYAAVAAAMDHPVDVLCTATAGKLILKGVAELLTRDAFGEGWMLIVRPSSPAPPSVRRSSGGSQAA